VAVNAENIFATVVHEADGASLARLENAFVSVVHEDDGATLARLENAFVSVVHEDDGATLARLENSFISAVIDPPPLTISVADITGAATLAASFTAVTNGSAVVWNWNSVPGGSTLVDAPIPFPDNGVAGSLDMTSNAVLYHFDGNANDTSGNAQNGTEIGSPTYAAGLMGQALSLNGVSQYIEVPDSPTTKITGNISISVWVNMTLTGDTFQRVVDKSTTSSGSGGYALYINTDGQPRFALSGVQTTGAATGLITAGTWHHVVATYDGTFALLYVDGVRVETSTALPNPGSSTAPLVIGAASWTAARDFNGLMEELAIWSRALTHGEIYQIYSAQKSSGAVDVGTTGTFVPDIAGTYTITAKAWDPSGAETTTTADAVIAPGPLKTLSAWATVVHDEPREASVSGLWATVVHDVPSGSVGFPGEDLRPLIGLFATRRKKDS
jgi:hypothetical protein